MGFDTMQERRALEKQLEEKKKQLKNMVLFILLLLAVYLLGFSSVRCFR